jgi:hypothetical protein
MDKERKATSNYARDYNQHKCFQEVEGIFHLMIFQNTNMIASTIESRTNIILSKTIVNVTHNYVISRFNG